MEHEGRNAKTILIIVAAALLLCACASRRLQDPTDWDKTYFAVVETLPGGTADPDKERARLEAYYRELQQVAGVTDLSQRYIRCFGCNLLSASTPPKELKFLFLREHLNNMYAFTRAMQRVQASSLGDLNFTLTYNTDASSRDPDCPVQCGPKRVCAQGCDGNKDTPVCDPC